MKSSVAVTLIICGTFLIIVPFISESIGTHQVANVMIQLDKSVDLKTGLPKSYLTTSITIGAIMVLIGTFISFRNK
ncbi:MAG: hypothetical protein KAS69_07945 [Planctomycetes bacterium]|nr:hypothetical protein [Planctomycetota bacterium]